MLQLSVASLSTCCLVWYLAGPPVQTQGLHQMTWCPTNVNPYQANCLRAPHSCLRLLHGACSTMVRSVNARWPPRLLRSQLFAVSTHYQQAQRAGAAAAAQSLSSSSSLTCDRV